MRRHHHSPRFERLSTSIDLSVYSRESRILIVAGICLGLVATVLIDPLFDHGTDRFETVPVRAPHIQARFVEVPPVEERTVQETAASPRPITASIHSVPVPQTPTPPETATASVPEQSEPTAERNTVLHNIPQAKSFTPYRDGATPELPTAVPDTTGILTWEDTFHGHPDVIAPTEQQQPWEYNLPLTERSIVTLGQGFGTLFWDPLNPVDEEPEDERRQFDHSFLGIPMGRGMTFVVVPGMIGFTATGLLPSLQHFIKRMKWKYEDGKALDNRQELAQAGFRALNEKDIRFLTLLWKHDRLNPDRMTSAERNFISESPVELASTNRAHLEDMTRRGLAVSLQKSGVIVYGATVTRGELIGGLVTALRQLYASEAAAEDSLLAHSRDQIIGYVQLIASQQDETYLSVGPGIDSSSQASTGDSSQTQTR